MDKQKRTTIDEFSAYLQSAVRNTTINYMNDKSKIKEHEITLEEDLENVEGRGIEWNEMMEAHDIFLGKIDPEKLFAQVTDNKLLHILKSFSALHIKVLCLRILYEKTFDEIGMAIGISGKKAENTYYNVIKKNSQGIRRRKRCRKENLKNYYGKHEIRIKKQYLKL